MAATKDQVAQLIVAEARARKHTRDECLAELSALYQESQWDETIWGPAGKRITYGIAQQDGSYPNRFDGAATQIRAFFDKLDVKRNHPGHGDIWLNICWLQQAPNWPNAQHWFDNGRRAYLAEIKSRIATVTPYLNKYWPTTGGTPVPDKRPFNEWPMWSPNNSDRRGAKVDLFLLHTQEGGGGNSAAEDLAKYLQGNNVSYHYSVGQASDGGVTVVDVVDTDRSSWSVLSANPRSINLCFAGSRASWTREQWMKQANAIDAAAYLAVQDCRKHGIPLTVIAPPYATARAGISDHAYVTKVLKDGTHTDVGPNFPWDHFSARVGFWAAGGVVDDGPDPTPPLTDSQVLRQIANDVAWLRQQQDIGLDAWGEDGDLGRNARGQRRTVRAGLAALIRKAGA